MNEPKLISAVIFDMDGLMLDTERMAQEAWRRAGLTLGYEIPDEVFLMAVGRTKADTEACFLQHLGYDFPFKVLYKRKQQSLAEAIETDGLPVKPGLLELLDYIDEAGLAKAVATSTARPLATKKLTVSGLLDRFAATVCGNEVENGKPAPDIFLAAAAALQMLSAHCMVLEDSEAGIKAAHAAGMTPIMVPDLKQPSAEIVALAYKVFPSLESVGPLLQQLAQYCP